MEPEPTLASLLEAIQTLTSQVGPCRPKSTLKANSSLSSSHMQGDQRPRWRQRSGRSPSQAWPIDWAYHSPTHTGGEAHTPGTVRPGLKAPSALQEAQALTPRMRRSQEEFKKEPMGTPKRSLSSLTPSTPGLQ
ncbi:hypothetical protein RHS01_09639 [Rhizoctonia solani]|uniref:Uncharacterized protein n=1 Tax=Rhizoctonia solani TaxID=456999 RepID=A0A8H7M0U8_9AGAM|nr:hypothetical protein RHS01_09639 [Rhizoctonia solani]